MLQGTERAIARIAEQLPYLVKALDSRRTANRPGEGPGFPPYSDHVEWEVREERNGTFSAVEYRASDGHRMFSPTYSGFPNMATAEKFVL